MSAPTSSSSSSSSSVLAAVSETGSTLAAQLGPSVVAIGRDGRGTGIVIGPDRVLTNAHNLRDRTTSVHFHDGRVVQATVSGLDADGDLAVMDVPTEGAPVATWAETPAEIGSVVFAVARGGGNLRLTFGTVSATDRTFHGPTGRPIAGALEHSAPLAKGSSGGPLVNADGHVVAITMRRNRDGFALARPIDAQFQARIAKLADGTYAGRPRLGVVLADGATAQQLRAAVGLSERSGLLVRAVEPSSLAATAGVSVGDLLVSANGVDLTGSDDLFRVLAEADTSITMIVVRGETERTVTVSLTPAD